MPWLRSCRAVRSRPAAATWSRQGVMARMPRSAHCSMMRASGTSAPCCLRTVAVLIDSQRWSWEKSRIVLRAVRFRAAAAPGPPSAAAGSFAVPPRPTARPWRPRAGGEVHRGRLLVGLQCGVDQLHALGAFGQGPRVGRVFGHMADEVLPLDLEAVVVWLRVRYFLPLLEEVHRLLLIRVPHRARRGHARLGQAR